VTVECPDCGKTYTPTSAPESWDCPRCSVPRKTNKKETGKK
jgi:DNA-directed RNA polymerase subunit RPC12/RpoP